MREGVKRTATKAAAGAKVTGRVVGTQAKRAAPAVKRGAEILASHPDVVTKGLEQAARRAGRYGPQVRAAGRLLQGAVNALAGWDTKSGPLKGDERDRSGRNPKLP